MPFYGYLIIVFSIFIILKVISAQKYQIENDSFILENKKDYIKTPTKIVGVTYYNDDGTSRQKYLERLKNNSSLKLKHVPSKKHPNSIGVFSLNEKQLGFLSSDLAKEFMDDVKNENVLCRVCDVYSFFTKEDEEEDEKEIYACYIDIYIYKVNQ